MDINKLRLEFEQLINDDIFFKNQWCYNDDNYTEQDFKEWLAIFK